MHRDSTGPDDRRVVRSWARRAVGVLGRPLVVGLALGTLATGTVVDGAPGATPVQGATPVNGPPDSGTWVHLAPSSRPLARFWSVMAYDEATSQLILFGGATCCQFFGDTWDWTGTTWQRLTPDASPSIRAASTMAYDQATGQLLLFGGTAGPMYGDTWDWTGTTWRPLDPATEPPARSGAAMAYDPATDQLVLFGGNNLEGPSGQGPDTWTWNGSDWTEQHPLTSPSGREFASMAFDAHSGQLLLFGGAPVSLPAYGDTWRWTGSNWVQLHPPGFPPARLAASMAYDPQTGDVLVTGGTNGPASLGNVGVAGQHVVVLSPTKNPPASAGAAMAYDEGTPQMVRFGGPPAAHHLLGHLQR